MHPKDKIIYEVGGVPVETKQTNAEVQLGHLSPEVLRDLARNESASKEWRKAAVELLILKNHPHAQHPELRELVLELQAEEDARAEVASLAAQHDHEEVAKEAERMFAPIICFICGHEVEVEEFDPEALYMCHECDHRKAVKRVEDQPAEQAVIDPLLPEFVETVPSSKAVAGGSVGDFVVENVRGFLAEASNDVDRAPENPSES